MARVRFKKTLTITVDESTMRAIDKLQAAGGKYGGRRWCRSAVIRRAILQAADRLGKT